MMTKQLAVLLLSGAFAFAQGPRGGGPGGPGGPGFGPGGFGGPVVTGAPYSGTETQAIQEKFADGNSVNTSTSVQRARDTQGRTYSSETITPAAATGKAPYTRTTITDPVAGERYELDSATMTAFESHMPKMRTTTASSAAPAAPTPGTTTRPNGATVTVASLGTQTVNGVLATGTQTTEVIPAGAIGNAQAITKTRTTWISTDLKLPVEIKSSDPTVGTSDMELTSISTGEPSATLFQVPSGYTVRQGGPGRGPGGGRGGSGGGAFRGGGAGPNGFGRRGGPGGQQ
jgi:hypothetical protein